MIIKQNVHLQQLTDNDDVNAFYPYTKSNCVIVKDTNNEDDEPIYLDQELTRINNELEEINNFYTELENLIDELIN